MKFLVLALLLISAAPALAQEPAAALAGSGAPVAINADSLEFNQTDRTYIARGNAEVEQNGVVIKADLLTAYYIEAAGGSTTFTEVHATGNVHITSGKGEIFGERGVYDVAREVAVIKGSNLRMVAGEDTVTAKDTLEFWQKENLAVARGEAVAIRGTNRVAADVLTAVLAENAAKQMTVKRVGAEGNVIITTPTEIAQGNNGVYDVAQEKATLNGNVRITRGENQLNGNRAEVNMATGVSRLLSAPGQRVRALIVPKDAPVVR